ncbi:serine/threonine protein kinase [Egibacter rhizosphaerae]|uniref:non-specific serine/threonine protein kinase n=1 Tax=Egibacter rhizosphaerae TaxID=1670831 RepID=A0A411YI50_9ACTN|nr:serine/threonine-protein kinase [Egibacter rhizosphaerae]QBI20877.1 serine/threonine protein kinase [Egibacter rhizosphaerae]
MGADRGILDRADRYPEDAPASLPSEPSRVTVLADRYELAELLGSGGMARVHAAYDRRLDRRVAVKLVHDELLDADPNSRQRLLREARSAARLDHPNTVAVHDVGEDDGRPFVVMELVEGATLADRLRARGRIPADEAVAIGRAVLDALEAAHARGLVHRDVKPSNVLLPTRGGVKLADFGIAKALDTATGGVTGTGQVVGSPRYLAPEQAAGREPSAASDLYSLGVVLYECLAGHPPFERSNPVAVALAHQQDPLPPLRDHAPHVAPALVTTVERALAKDPADRFVDAAEMRAHLRADGETVAASEPTPTPGETAALRPEDAPPSGPAGSRRWQLAALLTGGVLAVIALASLLLGEDAPDDPLGPTDEAAPGAEPEGPEVDPGTSEPDQGADAEEADEGEADARDLDELIGDLARDPGAAGERGEDLLQELMNVREEDEGAERAEEARDAIEEVADWIADDELEAEVGREAVEALEPVGRPDAPELAEVSALFAEVAIDRRAWGEKGEDLLSDLEDLLEAEEAEDRADDAGELINDLEEWIADAEIDDERGRRAQQVLEPVADAAT